MFRLFFFKMKEYELIEIIVLSKFLRVREQLFENLFVGQMHAKSWAIKSFIAEFPTILLAEFPVAFDRLVLVRFSIQLIHDLDAKAVHSPAEMLYNVKAVEDDFSRRKEFSGNVVVGAKHVHSNDFDLVSDLSGIAQKVIANGCLRSSV